MITPQETAELVDQCRARLERAGLTGSYLVRDLVSGKELGVDTDRVVPLASLAKVPLALAVMERIRQGRLDGAARLRIPPGQVTTPGPTGTTRFRHVADIAVEDALSMAVTISDNAAADALFDLVSPTEVTQTLTGWGVEGLVLREKFSELTQTPVETLPRQDTDLAHTIAIGSGTGGGGHRLAQLDLTRTNTGTAKALVDLLEAMWGSRSSHPPEVPPRAGLHSHDDALRPESEGTTGIDPWVFAEVRALMAANVHRHRLALDLASDENRWFSKTGTLMNHRHEIGVLERSDGTCVAIAALTESAVAASLQPAAEAVIADVARRLHEHLRLMQDS